MIDLLYSSCVHLVINIINSHWSWRQWNLYGHLSNKFNFKSIEANAKELEFENIGVKLNEQSGINQQENNTAI